MSNVWLYMPQCASVLRLIQLASEPHLFVTFTGAEFILIGYLADYNHIYPIYCDKVFENGHPPLEHFGLANPVFQHATEMPAIGTSAPLLDYVDLAYSDFNFYEQSTGCSLVKSFSSVKSDLGKVLKGAMSAHPDFATKTKQKAISFILIFNLGNPSQDEMKKRKKNMTTSEAKAEMNTDVDISTNILEPAPMNAIIMVALDHMYDQPHMFPEFSEAMRSLPFIT
ncbi:uncharacterized protein EDB93DRAFT_1256154 [Suillus bovinus]|uniref:uncharacterized protein n=1 Tax=Suillus bovinus TaxID=48563 RepID=UPI001B8712A3|nr:uncharacterized protein EDB93DRAFT_1256154 [Suillus bovinus]KAG2129680.1 hypothetical protein EDB93DRAFT_1256154 [Suillus bovinus]